MKIDSNFIEKWGPKYDEIEYDEDEYLTLIERVKEESKIHLSINLETFQRIINWKSPRVKGTVKWDDYVAYDETFRKIINPKYKGKMELLVDLPGIGAPVASTILHFIFPEIFPIYDFRTTEVLNRFGCLKSKTVSAIRYPEFQSVILKIRTELDPYNLRQIDRALFAYHKIHFGKPAKSISKCEKSRMDRQDSIPEVVRAICEGLGANGREIIRKDIITEAGKRGINAASVLPADYCDNTTTGRWSKHSFLYSIGPGRYVLAKFKLKYERLNV